VTKELETLLTELYVLIDDRVVEPRRGRGRRPMLSDAELLTLAVAQMLLGFDCERRWIRHARGSQELRALFPYIPGQSDYHKRLKAARGLLCKAIQLLAERSPSWFDDLWITDATPVTVRHVTRNGEALGPGRTRRIRVLRLLFALLLGLEALPGLRRGRHADHVVPGPSQDR
jgi:hypothetical protein